MAKPKQDERSSSTNKNIDVPAEILKGLLTPSEIRMLKNRFLITQHLEGGLSIRKVAEKVKVGTDTVVRVARMMEKSNLRKLLDKNINQVRKFKTQTPWIFGKNN